MFERAQDCTLPQRSCVVLVTWRGVTQGTRVIRQGEVLRWEKEFARTCTEFTLEKLRPDQRGMQQPGVAREHAEAGVAPIVAMPPPQPHVREMHVTKGDLKKYVVCRALTGSTIRRESSQR